MAIANTVQATIKVNFEDRFSGPACKAFEQFRKCAESVFRAIGPAGMSIFEKFNSGIDKFVDGIDRFVNATEGMAASIRKQKEVKTDLWIKKRRRGKERPTIERIYYR